MTTATSPTSSVHFPALNQDTVVKPNPHPYAIRTTSTGILSRSNSSGHNASRHHYVPLSPAPSRKGHRYSRSLTEDPSSTDATIPRPLPIPPTFTGNGRDYRQSTWTREGSAYTNGATTVEDLPSNPKHWTPTQLSTYLYTALRVSNSETGSEEILPITAVEGIIAFAREANINGRIFLRLIADDLDKRCISPAWRDALLTASRNLRQNVIKGRIWGRDPNIPDSPSPSLPSHPFTNSFYNSSSSSLELSDDDHEAFKPRPQRRGRVRGMVETFERSGSFSSESSIESDGSPRTSEELGGWLQSGSSIDESIASPLVTEPLPLASPSPTRPATEEPTVETLLAESERMGTWGAIAWEHFDMAPGVTVKRADTFTGTQFELDVHSDENGYRTLGPLGESKIGHTSSRRKSNQDRRVVTAIFTPAANGTPDVAVDGHKATDSAEPVVLSSDLSPDEPQHGGTAREKALEAELIETRALVDAFRARLEQVERKVADLELTYARNDVERGQRTSSMSEDPPVISGGLTAPDENGDRVSFESLVEDLEDIEDVPQGQCSETIDPDAVLLEDRPASASKPIIPESEPSTVSDLPQYVLLVGLGVCAVVLRVIIKRAAGRSSSFWRF